MALRVTFDLSEDDLRHFRRIMKGAREVAKNSSEDEIINAAESLLDQAATKNAPDFVTERLLKLRHLIEMLRDAEWKIPAIERNHVFNALAYFAEPDDLIPDHIPGLGFLDDAIMVELVTRELRHIIEAYVDFCRFRAEAAADTGAEQSREELLAARRKALHERMRRRSSHHRRSRRKSSGGTRLKLF